MANSHKNGPPLIGEEGYTKAIEFYLPVNAWLVEEPPNYSKNPLLMIDFDTEEERLHWAGKIGEPVFEWKDKNFCLQASHGGLCRLYIPSYQWVKPKSTEDAMRNLEAYAVAINAFCFLLDSSMIQLAKFSPIQIAEIRYRDLSILTWKQETFVGQVTPLFDSSTYSARSMSQKLARLILENESEGNISGHGHSLLREIFPHDVMPRWFIDLDSLNLACSRLTHILQDLNLLKAYSDLAKATAQHKQGDFDLAVALAWFVTERTLADHWSSFLGAHQAAGQESGRFNSKRMEFLKSGRDFTASIISNVLELSGEITSEMFKKIDRARQSRNQSVHRRGRSATTGGDSSSAINAAVDYLALRGGMPLTPNLGYSAIN